MDKNNNTWDAQDAPQKNTDNAFVKVGEDGKPKMPEPSKKEVSDQETVTESNKERR